MKRTCKERKSDKIKTILSEKKAITLIALIITIIVLLILAGISIATLIGENGIITRVQEAKSKTEEASDIEQIKLLINENQIKEHIIGDKLEKIKFNVTYDTKSIYDSVSGKMYEDGWYYITPENSEEMKLYNSYIVNYETGEIIKYDKNIHRILTNELRCITEGLVYAADPQNMTDGNNWGDAILHNFKEGEENSGWREDALMFDGIDDGIEVEDKSDYSNGITLEMYFKLRGKTKNQKTQILMMKRKTLNDGFFMFIGNGKEYARFEYGRIYIDIGGIPSYSNRLETDVVVKENEPIYITYTFNPFAENEKGILYVNSKKIETTNLGRIDTLIKTQKEANIQIGSDIYASNGGDNRYPFNGEIYAARVYNRPLTETEVQYNYNVTKLGEY